MARFNWTAIDWTTLIALSVFVLVAARLAIEVTSKHAAAALLTALLFASGFMLWTYSLHDVVVRVIARLPVIPTNLWPV